MREFTEQELKARAKSLLDQGINVIALSNGSIYQDNEAGAKLARAYSKKFRLKTYSFKGDKPKSKSKTTKKD